MTSVLQQQILEPHLTLAGCPLSPGALPAPLQRLRWSPQSALS